MRRAAALLVVIAVTRRAHADSLDLPGQGGRGIGRAGAIVVSSDDGASLIVNPAGLARRLSFRAQAGITLVDRAASFATDAVFSDADPIAVEDRTGVGVVGWGGAQIGLGERVAVGVAALSPTHVSHEWAVAQRDFNPAQRDGHLYPHRYAGTRLELARDTVGAAVAVRATPWLAIGASALLHHVSLAHERTLWAGIPGEEATLGGLSPAFDVRFGAEGTAWAPGVSLGVVIAPLDVPVELAASVSWSADASISGSVSLSDSRGFVDVARETRYVIAGVAPDARADLDLGLPTTVRVGARFVTPRAVVELDAEHWWIGEADPEWRVHGATLTPAGGEARALERVPLGPAIEDGFALRGAVDVDVVRGVLALTCGYAFSRSLVPRTRVTPIYPDADTHTFALGVEARVAGATTTLGVAWSARREVAVGSTQTGVPVVTPLASSSIPAAGGVYDGSTTIVGISVELEWE